VGKEREGQGREGAAHLQLLAIQFAVLVERKI